MMDTKTPSPSDAELKALLPTKQLERGKDPKVQVWLTQGDALAFARAVLVRWGQPQAVEQAIEALRLISQNSTDDPRGQADKAIALLLAAPPPQAVREPTPVRRAALALYTPPFRHEYGYIRDANNQMVADDAGSEMTGLIAARIRGWGRIQYMDKPEMRANALQDEVAEVVAEALNAYWSANGITKGGQHGAP